jgi:hypothetical protein
MSKNQQGTLVKRTMDRESRLIAKIDERERKGKNLENVDHAYGNYEVNKDGDKVWSF